MIQNPEDKNIGQVIVIRGCQGNGKTMICDVLGNLLNNEHYISTPNDQDLFGTHATALANKILVNWNEAVSNAAIFDKLKSVITDSKITINPKNVQASEISLFARLIITTNNTCVIKIEPTDRRIVAFQSTDKFADKTLCASFWKYCADHFKKPEFIACLYDFFNERDISTYDFKNNKPVTELYKEWKNLYLPLEICFIKEYLNDLIHVKNLGLVAHKVKGLEFYKEYCEHCCVAGYCKNGANISIKMFYANIQQYDLKTLDRPSEHGAHVFKFIPNNLYDELIKKQFIVDEYLFQEDMKTIIDKQAKFLSEYL